MRQQKKKVCSAEEVHGSILEEASRGPETIAELWKSVRSRDRTVEFDTFRRELEDLASRGLIEIVEPNLNTFREYLKTWRFGFGVWLFTASVLSALAIVELESGFPLVLRWVAGTFLVLFAPGYALTTALFVRKEQPALNQLALTIAMSLFFVPALALVLNYTPVGIQPRPIALIISTVALGLYFVGANRSFQLKRRARL